ncbi:MAG: PA2779 family protein [Desulfobacterales bacterium]|nr:PA2779 family protein [Desulfobacterales bacterium]
MIQRRLPHRAVSALTALALLYMQLGSVLPVQAAIVSSVQVIAPGEADDQRSRIRGMLARKDVCRQLQQWGVDPAEAQARIDSLDEAELAQLAARIDTLPAGGGALEVIVISALIVFLVLLFTDIAGYTDVFPFVH